MRKNGILNTKLTVYTYLEYVLVRGVLRKESKRGEK